MRPLRPLAFSTCNTRKKIAGIKSVYGVMLYSYCGKHEIRAIILYNSTRVFNNLTTVLAIASVTFHRYYESYFNGYKAWCNPRLSNCPDTTTHAGRKGLVA